MKEIDPISCRCLAMVHVPSREALEKLGLDNHGDKEFHAETYSEHNTYHCPRPGECMQK